MHRIGSVLVVAILFALTGCSGEAKLVPVSGVVTVDGKPYAKAVVSFQPIGTKDNPNPGRGSSAYTDENGRFVLVQDGTNNGAVIGKHQVRIMTRGNDVVVTDTGIGSSDDTSTQKKTVEVIPAEWHANSNKEFDVPPGGTDQANFDITSINAKKK